MLLIFFGTKRICNGPGVVDFADKSFSFVSNVIADFVRQIRRKLLFHDGTIQGLLDVC